jgi:hypothetical protein
MPNNVRVEKHFSFIYLMVSFEFRNLIYNELCLRSWLGYQTSRYNGDAGGKLQLILHGLAS